MNKLGYKQKGMPMLKSPLKIDGVTGGEEGKRKNIAADASKINTTLSGGLTEYGARIKAENAAHGRRAEKIRAAPGKLFNAITGGFFTEAAVEERGKRFRATSADNIAEKNYLSKRRIPSESAGKGIFPSTGRNTEGFQFFDHTTLKPPAVNTKGNGKVNLPKNTNATQANTKTTQTNTKKFNEGPGVDKTGKNTYRGTKYLEDGSIDSAYKNKSDKIVSKGTKYLEDGSVDSAYKKSSNKKPTAKLMSRKDIRKEKRANIKGGMSRQEARLKKTQSKAASAKAKTNSKSAAIDATNSSKSYKAPKEESVRKSKAKSIRLQKRAERLKGRVNASKVNK